MTLTGLQTGRAGAMVGRLRLLPKARCHSEIVVPLVSIGRVCVGTTIRNLMRGSAGAVQSENG